MAKLCSQDGHSPIPCMPTLLQCSTVSSGNNEEALEPWESSSGDDEEGLDEVPLLMPVDDSYVAEGPCSSRTASTFAESHSDMEAALPQLAAYGEIARASKAATVAEPCSSSQPGAHPAPQQQPAMFGTAASSQLGAPGRGGQEQQQQALQEVTMLKIQLASRGSELSRARDEAAVLRRQLAEQQVQMAALRRQTNAKGVQQDKASLGQDFMGAKGTCVAGCGGISMYGAGVGWSASCHNTLCAPKALAQNVITPLLR